MNEEELKKQIKQEIKQELKKEQKRKRNIILVIILVIIAVALGIIIKQDIEREPARKKYEQELERIQAEQEELEKQQEYERLRINIPANISYYKGQLEHYRKELEYIKDGNSARKYIKEGYEEFKRFVELSNNDFTEEERKNANDVIKQYEATIKKYNIN